MSFAFFVAVALIEGASSLQPTPLNREAWVTEADYPAPVMRASEEGRVAYRLSVDAAGAVTGCYIIVSSGSAVLDVHTCDLMRLRARFEPARDSMNQAVASSYSSEINWTLPTGSAVEVSEVWPLERTTIDILVGS